MRNVSILRRAARSLPPPAQLWLKTVDASLRDSDWAEGVREVRLREQPFIDATRQQSRELPGRKRFLFLALQTPSPWSATECSLAMALQLRGHDVRGLLCDGLLPLCEMNLGVRQRPPCEVCVGWRARYYDDAFGFTWPRLTRYLSPEDRDDASRIVERVRSDDLADFVIDGVHVGRFARRELQRYHRGFVFEPAADSAFRQWVIAGVLIVRLIARALAQERPDIVVASSGRTLASACLLSVARQRGIHTITWDTEPSYADALVFAHDSAAVEVPLDEAWRRVADEELSVAQRARLQAFLHSWARSEITPFPYNPSPLDKKDDIRATLGLRRGAPLVVAFANSAWDMAVVDRDAGFSSMFAWLFALVEYAQRHPEIDLVVRAHPAETNVPADLQSRTPVAAEIRRRYAPLPPNVALVEGTNRISSYTLAAMAQVATVYSSRLGLEIALTGKKPWLAGSVTYRGRGFTRDLESPGAMTRLLDARVLEETLTSAEVSLAERFAYLWFFRYVTRVPLLRPADQHFRLATFHDLASGAHPIIDRLCTAMVDKTAFLDLDG